MDDPYNLSRFVAAQDPVYVQVCAELRAGQKRSHWMWFIFPQIKGLGTSPTAMKFAVASRAEAQAFLDHPVLGPRLRECTRLVLQSGEKSIGEILDYPDDVKFRSSMTLFASIATDNKDFVDALTTFYGGEFDTATLERL
jgi:uncharacterized protein (DUF1810 family)